MVVSMRARAPSRVNISICETTVKIAWDRRLAGAEKALYSPSYDP